MANDQTTKKDAKQDKAAFEADGASMHIKVYSPYKVYFDSIATSISAINDTGPFDILPQHHNFMTLLNAGDITIRTDRGEERLMISRGILHVKKDEVVVFLDI